MTARPPVFVDLALRLIALVSVLVPRRDRDDWRREREAEILHGQRALDRGPGSHFGAQAAPRRSSAPSA